MPIIIDDIQTMQAQAKTKAVPTYFDKSLTGSGKATGLLNKHLLPLRQQPAKSIYQNTLMDIGRAKRTRQDGVTEYKAIPMFTIANDNGNTMVFRYLNKIPDDAVNIEKDPANPIWLYVSAYGAILAKDLNGTSADRKLYMKYFVAKFHPEPNPASTNSAIPKPVQTYMADITVTEWLDDQAYSAMPNVDPNLVKDYYDSLTVYDTIINAAEAWMHGLPDIFNVYVNTKSRMDSDVIELVRRANDYTIDLSSYWKLYDILKTSNKTALLENCCDVNLNLLLNNTLQQAEIVKPSIRTISGKLPYEPAGVKPSMEQMAAITSEEPYVIVQSGAGVGKSFTIQHRLRYLEECGEDLKKIVVLSFTNAAANHIHKISPQVNSKTIASMILDIYDANFKHKLSQPETMINMIDADKSLTNDRVAQDLKKAMIKLRSNVNTGMMLLSSIAKNNYDRLIQILDKIKQTTLELQAAICYNADGRLTEPVIGCDHIIMDEVQDSSIFEFIYIIRYAIRHKSTLYFIGDGSQTLYEFRASNPKAMNCLEMSGVFACMKLQTNYRSNQNILDFANLSLKKIEANQFANIQLMANEFKTDKFEQNVEVVYGQAKNLTEKRNTVTSMLSGADKWIRDKFDKKEQVCILAYTRKDIAACKSLIDTAYPGKQSIDITPAKTYNDTFFSRYVCKLGRELQHRASADITVEIMRHMVDNLHMICREDQKDRVKEMIEFWRKQYKQQLALYEMQMQAGTMKLSAFKDAALQTLIDYEIDHNAILSRLVTSKNAAKKEADISSFDFVFSTIHSAKGLEFDNVVLVYDEDRSSAEDEKRMYYVALTRAKHAEYVITTGKTQYSELLHAYETMRDMKKKNAAARAKAVVTALTENRNRFKLPQVHVTLQHETCNAITCTPVTVTRIKTA